ncbi:MAG TPA: tetratricopeptide repeat protein [Terracidiphilus sp.]|jgi:tetratricopeptide (TPR) repeat protein|nr:tetratricopeptide repeat protein [Terracidiphilus sp.]
MRSMQTRLSSFGLVAACGMLAAVLPLSLCAQSSSRSQPQSSGTQSSSASQEPDENGNGPQSYAREKTPSIVDPAGPTISLVSPEQVFIMAAGLNMCGYDDGLQDSAPVRKQVRDEINKALAASEDARKRRDELCLYIAQHRMTGTQLDVAQYISLSLYLSPAPKLEPTVELSEMPPDATQVADVVPLLRNFAAAVDLHGIWLTLRHTYDTAADQVHGPLSKMMVATNLYLKMPAPTYDGRRFIVIIEPLLSPNTVNARIYGTDYVVVLSPVDGAVHMTDVHHIYLHYLIEPLLYSRTNAIDREQPILKEIRDAPLAFRYRSDTVALTVECLIKAIEARTMDTGVAPFKMPANFDRSELPRYDHERQLVEQKAEGVRQAAVQHDMKQGFVLTQYFYQALLQFEKDSVSLPDTMGEMVYGMDIDQQVHRARLIDFDQTADSEVLGRNKPHKLSGMDLAESKLSSGDVAGATAIAQEELQKQPTGAAPTSDSAHAYFILARAAAMTGHPEQAIDDFQKTLATSKEQRLLAWSHIYLGRMLDLDCKRDQALSEYKLALTVRDGREDTRLAAERGVKSAYIVNGHTCEDVSDDDQSNPPLGKPAPVPGQNGSTGSGNK